MNKLDTDLNNTLKRLLEMEDFQQPEEDGDIEEMSTSAGAGAYNTPNAFASDGDESHLDNDHIEVLGYKKVPKKKKVTFVPESTFKKFATEMNGLNEVSYKDYKGNDTLSSKQKLNTAIKEINSQLFQMERFFKQNKRLKEEDSLNKDAYWKATSHKIFKIHERLKSIQSVLEEFDLAEVLAEVEQTKNQKILDFIVACNAEVPKERHWSLDDLQQLDNVAIARVYNNRIKLCPELAIKYKAK